MSNWIVTIRRGRRDEAFEPEIEATWIVPDQVERYPHVTLRYEGYNRVVTTVVMQDCTKDEALAGASAQTHFMLKESEYIG